MCAVKTKIMLGAVNPNTTSNEIHFLAICYLLWGNLIVNIIGHVRPLEYMKQVEGHKQQN